MQLKALTSAALLAGAQAFVAPGASKPALVLRAEEVEAAPVEVAPVAEAAPEAEAVAPVAEVAAVAPEPVLTTPSVRSTRAPPRAWDIALDMPAGISAPFGYFDPAGLGKKVSEQRAKFGAVWKSTTELGYPEKHCGDLRDPSRRRAAAPTGTTSRRWRRISTPSSRCSCWDDVASMAWEVQNLISSQVLPRVRAQARPRGHARRLRLPGRGALPPALRRQHRRAVLCGNQPVRRVPSIDQANSGSRQMW
jgi:hypothetical protein